MNLSRNNSVLLVLLLMVLLLLLAFLYYESVLNLSFRGILLQSGTFTYHQCH